MRELKLEDLMKRGGGVGNCGYDKGGNNNHCPRRSHGGKKS
jgi:hypothetical protein